MRASVRILKERGIGRTLELLLGHGDGERRIRCTILEVFEDGLLVQDLDAAQHFLPADELRGWSFLDKNIASEKPTEPPAPPNSGSHTDPRGPCRESVEAKETGIQLSNIQLAQAAAEAFGAKYSEETAIPVPSPNFILRNEIDRDDQQELMRAKNIYDYAMRVKEPDRLARVIDILQGLTSRNRRPDLFLLLGHVASISGAHNLVPTALGRADLLRNSAAQLILAERARKAKDYKTASECLLRGLLAQAHDITDGRFLKALAHCLSYGQRAHLSGIEELPLHVGDPTLKSFAAEIVAYNRFQMQFAAPLAVDGVNNVSESFGNRYSVSQPSSDLTPVSPAKEPLRMKGRVTALFQSLGYLEESGNQRTFFFRCPNVSHEELARQLRGGIKQQRVTFVSDFGSLDARGFPLAEDLQPDGALPEVVLPLQRKLDGGRSEGRGGAAYLNGKKAESENDLATAERSFRVEIGNNGFKKESAVKDLALILNRQGRADDALQVLDEYGGAITSSRIRDNIRVTILIKAQRFKEAIPVNRALLAAAGSPGDKATLLSQLAYFLFRTGQHEKALAELNAARTLRPSDPNIDNLIRRVKEAKSGPALQTATTGDESLMDFAAWKSPDLSAFALYRLDSSKLEFIDERSKARGYYDESDFRALESLLERFRGRRPQEKGQVLLTLARLCQLAPEAAGERDLKDYLSRSFCFFGEAEVGNKNRDAARIYLAESLSLTLRNDGIFTVALAHLMSTYVMEVIKPGCLEDRDGNVRVRAILPYMESNHNALETFIADCPYYSALCERIQPVIERELRGYGPLTNSWPSREQFKSLRENELVRLKTERDGMSAISHADQYTTSGVFEDVAATLDKMRLSTRFDADKHLLQDLASIAKQISDYWKEGEYSERHFYYRRSGEAIRSYYLELEASPTRLGIESLKSVVTAMQVSLERNFAAYMEQAKTILEFSNVIPNDYYMADSDGCIQVRIDVASKSGGAPVEALELVAREIDGLVQIDAGISPRPLRGGEKREIELKVKPSPQQFADQTFTLEIAVRYTKSNGEPGSISDIKLPIRLGRPSEFVPIQNPYEKFATGRSIGALDSDMFKGRKDILERIIKVIQSGDLGQCFALHGQKRSGKTSVLNQLLTRFTCPCLAVEITVGLFDTSNPNNFYRLALDQILLRLRELSPSLDLAWWPADQLIRDDTLTIFRRTIQNVSDCLTKAGWNQPKLVLLIDEFTYLYEYIEQGILDRNFMRHWKAMLQMRLFSAVVFGQDTMPQFIMKYQNEFGSLKEERLSYLTYDEAIELADAPVRLDGASRFRGRALNRMVRLTAGSPFYMQILCDEIVNHMNARRSPWASEADIDIVSRRLTTGRDALPLERFDPLITAAGEAVALAPREDYLLILRAIANNSTRHGARLTELPDVQKRELILEDMRRRQVISSDAEGRLAIEVNLFAEWLRAQSSN